MKTKKSKKVKSTRYTKYTTVNIDLTPDEFLKLDKISNLSKASYSVVMSVLLAKFIVDSEEKK